ncbi:hypothetical protein RJ639_005021 [Escallonia herrerae]|uniref:Phytocyanin domain-containing protein n=1 Tax=Escallonia herrerae TaxID=1293975 RepID=A0AA88W2J8_9ASTE|nr:hypothetical protein RJ639_005021 [Escallonia herrerae]
MASNNAMSFLLMFAFVGVCMGDVYKVGDSAGWTADDHVNYKKWSATKKFCVGDIIVFEYNKEYDNVVRVTHKNFNACNGTAPYATYATGNDSFTIKNPGHYYFISTVPGHCKAGQKVDIRAPGSPAPPDVDPSPTPSEWPSPAPSPTKSGSSGHSTTKLWLSMGVALLLCVFGIA